MTASPIRIAREGIALVVTLDDPASRNALSSSMVDALAAAVAQLRDDAKLRALVLRGSDTCFCAGGALKGSGAAESIEATRAINIRGGELLRAIFDCPVPVIAVVEGPAFGGGFGLACCADIVIAGPGARFALSEASLGLVPAQIAPFVLHRLGGKIATRLALTGERCDAIGAVAIGLADHQALDSAGVEAILTEQIAMIARCAPGANAATKALFRTAATIDPSLYAQHAADIFIAALMSEGQEGVAAFAAKRKPYWREGDA